VHYRVLVGVNYGNLLRQTEYFETQLKRVLHLGSVLTLKLEKSMALKNSELDFPNLLDTLFVEMLDFEPMMEMILDLLRSLT
jgi:hypothetical protein